MASRKKGGRDNSGIVIVLLLVFAFLKYGDANTVLDAMPSAPTTPTAPMTQKPTRSASSPAPSRSTGPGSAATQQAAQSAAEAAYRAKPGPAATDTTSPLPSKQQALAELALIPTQPRVFRDPTYRRSEFGPRWADVDRNGCNTRDDVLYRTVDRNRPFTAARQGRCDHDMVAGTWHDPYTGKTLTFTNLKDQKQSQALQIDHAGALAMAWRYGAKGWTSEKRRRYANWQPQLLAVDGKANNDKSDLDIAAWRPRKAYQCNAAKLTVHTLYVWGLNKDAAQDKAAREMLATCTD